MNPTCQLLVRVASGLASWRMTSVWHRTSLD